MTISAKKGVAAITGAMILLTGITRAGAAQENGTSRAAAACSYSECALSIAPTWNGLMVVRGSAGRSIGTLNFFLPRDIAPTLVGDPTAPSADSVRAHAERAVALRRAGAVLTDAGAAAVAVALAHVASAGRPDRRDRVVAAAGVASLLVSIPIQFAADGGLGRAVWWHNLRYAR
jgi:hypothetical protein